MAKKPSDMLKSEHNPNIPMSPPGYVFYSNFGAFDYDTKMNHTPASIIEDIHSRHGIAIDAILVLENAVESSPFSVFLDNRYSKFVESRDTALRFLMDALFARMDDTDEDTDSNTW